jgi:microcystin-dependent protein
MAKLPRVYQKIFASSAGTGQIGKYGSLAAGSPATTTDPAQMQSLSNWLGGWFSGVVGSNSPAIEDMNAVHYVGFYQLAYLMQQGIAEYDATTEYYIGSMVQDGNGAVYVSLTGTTGSPNVGNAVTSTTNWKPYGKKIASPTTTYTATANDDIILADPTSGSFVVTLPAVSSNLNKTYYIKMMGSSLNTVTVKGNGAELIDDLNTYLLSGYGAIYVHSNGTKWSIISSYSKATIPTGSIIPYSGSSAPSGFLFTDGSSLSTTTYANLFASIGYTYGGSGANFSLPDTRGIFLRGAGTNGSMTTSNGTAYSTTLGTKQNDQLQGHYHRIYQGAGQGGLQGGAAWANTQSGLQNLGVDISNDGTNGVPRAGNETRPANLGVNHIIKY